VSAPTLDRVEWLPVDTADEILPADAPREQWLAERAKGLGGSDTSAVLGLNKYTSAIKLWLEKTGRAHEDPDNDLMEWGRRLEPVVADWFTDHTGIPLARVGLFRHRVYPVLQCTPDRLTPDGGLEIKTLDHNTEHLWADDQIPDHAELQSQKCMAVTGRGHWWVVGLVNGRRPLLRRVERNEALIERIVAFETGWWRDYVLADEMPPLDASESTNEALRAWIGPGGPDQAVQVTPELLGLLAEWNHAKDMVRAAEAEQMLADSRLRLAIGTASVVVADLDAPHDDSKAGKANTLLTLRADGSFGAKAFAEAHPELAAQHRRQVEVLDAAAVKEQHPDEHRACRARVLRPRKAALTAYLDRLDTPGEQ
jgi:putative phage-type endonuclease